MLHDQEKAGSAVVKKQYLSPQLFCYGALTELTQTGSGAMPENVANCDNMFAKSGTSCMA